jgi:hypothetical protein
MAKQFRVIRKIASVPITANGFATLDLPRDYDYEAIGLSIVASLQVTVLATSVRAEAPCQLVPRIEIVADGKNNLYSAPFWYAALGNVRRRLTSQGARATTPPSGVAVATYAVEANGFVDFATIDGVRPKDSNFRARGLSLFQLRLTFGAAADAFVGGTVAFSGSPVVDVYAMQLVEETDDKGNFLTSPISLRKVSYQEQAFASSNANAEFRLPAGNLIRSVFVRTDGSATAGEPSTAVLNNLSLQNGIDVRYNLSARNTRSLNNGTFGLVTSGYYVADFLSRGGEGNSVLSELWDVTGAAEPKAIVDVTGGANVKVQVVTEEYILRAA